MISHLHIENIAVIKNADVFLSPGLNILTGETGAGKSIIIEAINLIFGGRTNRDMIRKDSDRLLVSAVINDLNNDFIKFINELGYQCEDDTLLLHREFNENGKNICKINGRPATVSILRQIGKKCIDVYSQHDGYKLLSSDTHVKYIDIFGELNDELQKYREIYDHMIKIKKEIKDINLDEHEIERRSELLKYQINEIEEANISEGEIERLTDIKNRYNNKQKILSLLNSARELLGGDDVSQGAIDKLQCSSENLNEASGYINELIPIYERLQGVFYEASECLTDLNPILESLEYDPQEFENAEMRLDVLYKLSRKYGNTEKDILVFLESSKKELEKLENSNIKVADLEKKLADTSCKVNELGKNISDKRKIAGKLFTERVKKELEFLDMPNVKFEISQENIEPCQNGIDKIQFLISVNKGEPLKPISCVASGGELSRIMLAIKNVVSDNDNQTVIFDEVDTGVSGSAANKIGLKLKELSGQKQIICITHLAQIASLADEHFLIHKDITQKHTESNIKRLDFDGRKHELARIIGGINISDMILKTAEEMLTTNKSKQ